MFNTYGHLAHTLTEPPVRFVETQLWKASQYTQNPPTMQHWEQVPRKKESSNTNTASARKAMAGGRHIICIPPSSRPVTPTAISLCETFRYVHANGGSPRQEVQCYP